MRVLVVEDEPDVASMLHAVLLDLGHEPFVVRSAAAALVQVEADWPDAILLELDVPGLSALDFLRLDPVRKSAVPIVATARQASEGQARECLRLGAVEFLSKPVERKRLGEILDYIEPQALARRLGHAGPERRRAPRVRVGFPVRVSGRDGSELETAAWDLSQFGIRVAGRLAAPAGTAALVALALPDGQPPLQVPSVLLRSGGDGCAFSFLGVGADETRRLAKFTRVPR